MRAIKKLNFKKLVSYLIIFTLVFSQNNVMVFADILRNTKSTIKISNKSDNENKSLETTTSDSSSKETENNSVDKSIELGNIQEGSYIFTKEGIYPFTGEWGEEYSLESQQSNGEQNTLEGEISIYENKEEGHYYKQLDEKSKLAYNLYYNLLTSVDQSRFLDVSEHKLSTINFYGVLTAVLHENP